MEKEPKKVVRIQLERHKWPDEIEKEKKQRRYYALTISLCVIFFVLGFLGHSAIQGNIPFMNSDTRINDVLKLMNKHWYFGKDMNDEELQERLMNQAIQGVFLNVEDKHSAYYTSEEAKEMAQSMEGVLTGIGITSRPVNSSIVVNDVIDNSPADKAGLQTGDWIIEVDGKTEEDYETLMEMFDALKGNENSIVTLTIDRNGKKIKKKIQRESMDYSVDYRIVDDVPVVTISNFMDNTGVLLGKSLEEIDKLGYKNLIIDLRNNPGGYVQSAQQVLGYFLGNNKTALISEDVNGKKETLKTVSLGKTYKFDHLVILANENSASASEVVALALKEKANAVIVGKKTYGKGIAQSLFPLPDGSQVKITTFQWYSPNGTAIHNKGIEPDKEVEDYTYSAVVEFSDEILKEDMVREENILVNQYLNILGYPTGRDDAYFSDTTKNALIQYQKTYGYKQTGTLDKEGKIRLYIHMLQKYQKELDLKDTQLREAINLCK